MRDSNPLKPIRTSVGAPQQQPEKDEIHTSFPTKFVRNCRRIVRCIAQNVPFLKPSGFNIVNFCASRLLSVIYREPLPPGLIDCSSIAQFRMRHAKCSAVGHDLQLTFVEVAACPRVSHTPSILHCPASPDDLYRVELPQCCCRSFVLFFCRRFTPPSMSLPATRCVLI